jgi:hypothetical protein
MDTPHGRVFPWLVMHQSSHDVAADALSRLDKVDMVLEDSKKQVSPSMLLTQRQTTSVKHPVSCAHLDATQHKDPQTKKSQSRQIPLGKGAKPHLLFVTNIIAVA